MRCVRLRNLRREDIALGERRMNYDDKTVTRWIGILGRHFLVGLFVLTSSYGVLWAHPVMSYSEYLQAHETVVRPSCDVAISIEEVLGEARVVWEYANYGGPVVITEEQEVVTWEFIVPESGFYNILLDYYPVLGRGSAIERELWINGERPFAEAGYLVLSRVWADGAAIRRDVSGNEIRPPQVERPEWRQVFLRDSRGYNQEPYLFYFEAGVNTLSLVGLREPLAIGAITLIQEEQPPPYDQWLHNLQDSQRDLFGDPSSSVLIKVQGQASIARSDSTLFAIADQGDPTLEPYHPAQLRLNTIGGQRWSRPGQWMRWEFEIPQTGLYKIAIKAKQNMRRGFYSNRQIKINGKVPFGEARALTFPYSSRYAMHVLGNGEPYLFYLEKGLNTIELEVVLGGLAELMRVTENALYELNTFYRRIIMITSANPDPIRDYQLEDRIPGTLEEMLVQSGILDDLADQLEEYTGQKGGHALLLRNLARQLRDMSKDPDTIARRLAEYRDNLAALGNWILETMDQPLQVDYLVIATPEQAFPTATPSPGQVLLHEVQSLIASFSHQYNVVGAQEELATDRQPLRVWVATGRDQAQSLKTMIDDTFTPTTGIPVAVELVNMNVLLAATLAGKGPDVALGVDPSLPMNFGLRGAVLNLRQFPDFGEVAARFGPGSFTSYAFRDAVFGLPEQQPFYMLFYRQDILDELGLEIPQTWEDVVQIIPELQKDNMNFGLPFTVISRNSSGSIGDSPAGAGSLSSSQGVTTFLMFLNQRGEELFKEDAVATNLDSKIAVNAFTMWTDLYELYNLPLDYSPENRFRLGEMPLVIAPYPLYNILTVFAPELRGQWGFTSIPGTQQLDGTINRRAPAVGKSTITTSTACIILSDVADHEVAWEFLKWWTSAETQARYGRELESLMGPAARYPTANMAALATLPWTVDEYRILLEQWEWVTGIPEVPGGYMVGRHLDNAFRRVVFQHEPARETILDYNRVMNEELAEKRWELKIAGGN